VNNFEKLESPFVKLEKQKGRSALVPFVEGERASGKWVIGKSSLKNWKTKWKGPWQK